METWRKDRVYAYCGSCHTQTPVTAITTHEADVYVYCSDTGALSFPFEENDIDTGVENICSVCHAHIEDNTDDLYQRLLRERDSQIILTSEDSAEYMSAFIDFCTLVDHGSFVNKGSAFDKSHTGSIWFSGEGGTTINGESIIYYYSTGVEYTMHPKLEEFMKRHNMYVEWYDAGTPFLYFK